MHDVCLEQFEWSKRAHSVTYKFFVSGCHLHLRCIELFGDKGVDNIQPYISIYRVTHSMHRMARVGAQWQCIASATPLTFKTFNSEGSRVNAPDWLCDLL